MYSRFSIRVGGSGLGDRLAHRDEIGFELTIPLPQSLQVRITGMSLHFNNNTIFMSVNGVR